VNHAGSSDPFCEVYVNDERKYVTEYLTKTLAPVWNEMVRLELPNSGGSLEIVSNLQLLVIGKSTSCRIVRY